MSNRTDRRGSARILQDTADVGGRAVPSDNADAADTIKSLSSHLPSATPRATPAPAKIHKDSPVPGADGRGAFVWKRTGDHETQAVWDPSAEPVMATPFPLGADLVGTLFHLARRHALNGQRFVAWCSEHTALVRAAARSYRESGAQWVAWDDVVHQFKAQA